MRGNRNMRGALSALLFAGAAYAWRNRDRLSQQLDGLRNRSGSSMGQAYPPHELPDLSRTEQRDFSLTPEPLNERELGGTSL